MAGMKALQFVAIVLGAVALVPGGAHVASLLNKINLSQSNYFIAQEIYRGWNLFAIVLIGNLLANLALAVAMRAQDKALWFVLANLLCIAGSLAIFFAFTFPANQATDNWTAIPANWQQLRWQWEMSHAANELVTFVGFCSLIISVLLAQDRV
jgi:uncharacterized membrane protein HdeD (DUF308 family)